MPLPAGEASKEPTVPVAGTVKLHEQNAETLVFHCPGCNCNHGYDARWIWNGSMESPTFTPSLRCNEDDPASCCHLKMTDGVITFYDDCHHELRGRTVPVPDWEGW